MNRRFISKCELSPYVRNPNLGSLNFILSADVNAHCGFAKDSQRQTIEFILIHKIIFSTIFEPYQENYKHHSLNLAA